MRFALHLEPIEVHTGSDFPIRPTPESVPNICCHPIYHLSAEGLKHSSDINGNQDKKCWCGLLWLLRLISLRERNVGRDSCNRNFDCIWCPVRSNKRTKCVCSVHETERTSSSGFSQMWQWSSRKNDFQCSVCGVSPCGANLSYW